MLASTNLRCDRWLDLELDLLRLILNLNKSSYSQRSNLALTWMDDNFQVDTPLTEDK